MTVQKEEYTKSSSDRDVYRRWGDIRNATLGGVLVVTAFGHLSGFAEADQFNQTETARYPRYISGSDKAEEVSEQVGTSLSSEETAKFDYIEERHTVRDLAETLSNRSRGFNKDESEGYGEFLDSIFN